MKKQYVLHIKKYPLGWGDSSVSKNAVCCGMNLWSQCWEAEPGYLGPAGQPVWVVISWPVSNPISKTKWTAPQSWHARDYQLVHCTCAMPVLSTHESLYTRGTHEHHRMCVQALTRINILSALPCLPHRTICNPEVVELLVLSLCDSWSFPPVSL